jgi:carboxylesterase
VFVGGLSLGGLITLYLAAHYPFCGAIVMSAPAYIHDWRLRFLPIVRLFLKWHYASGELDATDPQAIERVSFYRRVPISFGGEFQALLKAVHLGLPKVKMPLLFMQGAYDRTIPPESARFFYDRVGSREREIVMFPNSGHPITVDTEREAVWRRTYEFITQYSV